MITVSIPYYRTPDTIRRAVESVLAQSYAYLAVVVVNDGDQPERAWEPLAGIEDSRLIRFDLPTNRGRYYADTVVAYAARSDWFTTHDSDDWSHPRRLEHMMRVAKRQQADVVPGTEHIHMLDGRERVRRPVLKEPRSPQRFPHLWHVSALYRTEVFRLVCHPGFRVGYDSLMSAMLLRCSDVRIAACGLPHYHRVARSGSLTHDEATGIGSEFRRAEVERLTEIWERTPRQGSAMKVFGLTNWAHPMWQELNIEARRLQAHLEQACTTT